MCNIRSNDSYSFISNAGTETQFTRLNIEELQGTVVGHSAVVDIKDLLIIAEVRSYTLKTSYVSRFKWIS